ncbi:universal stress protein [Adhaeretor mobilis]|uniref:Universal stress protein n=1 Tax=Adhaeretor mobilis TaxID=1930276 RepID=A0A517MZB5_9BACT|nr:universal stress protein [Adhaeretor mobilis]QDT00231.1 Universal stress protein [Adhaeretor mobilis]
MKALCAIDGSAGSDAAVQMLGRLLSEDDLVIFYYSPPELTVHGQSVPDLKLVEQARASLAEKVFEHARELLPQQLSEHSIAITGLQKPRLGIIAAAKEHRPDLIAVGARGTNRLGLPRIGSVSRAVVHSTEVPVLIARPSPHDQSAPLRVLLCYDRIDENRDADALLGRLSFPSNTEGRILHVVESPFVDGIPSWIEEEARAAKHDPIAKAYIEEQDEKFEELRQQLTDHCRELPSAFLTSQPAVLGGRAGAKIVKYAESEEMNLVVIGAHHTGAVMRVLIGSTSEHVLSHANCSVLIVPHHDVP